MNILIVIPKYWPMPFAYYDFPVGLAYISAVLKRAGHTVDILNLTVQNRFDLNTLVQ